MSHPILGLTASSAGFTLIELLIVVVIIGILAAIAIPKFAATKQQAYLASMRSDLRNIATIEEAYVYDNSVYTDITANNVGGTGTPDPATNFMPSSGVTVSITATGAQGWSGTATHSGAPGRVCAMFEGSVPALAPATVQGQIACN